MCVRACVCVFTNRSVQRQIEFYFLQAQSLRGECAIRHTASCQLISSANETSRVVAVAAAFPHEAG